MRRDFTALLNRPPLKSEIAINAQAKNSEYIPIGIVQNKLDEMFQGLWKTENFTSQIYQNEIIGSLELHVFHPVNQCWITRIGSASVMIQENKETKEKIKNTLVKDYPHLLSECLKSASKTLGASFGRNLNKVVVDEYQSIPTVGVEFDEITAVERAIMESTTKEEVISLYNGLTHLKENKQIKKVIQLRITQLKSAV